MAELFVKTSAKREIVDITEEVNGMLRNETGAKEEGVVNLFLTHTTAALATADLDPGGTDADYLDALEALIPKLSYRHPHDPTHMPDHISSTLIGTSLTIPYRKGALVLGRWQRVVLIECDGPRERRIIASLIPVP